MAAVEQISSSHYVPSNSIRNSRKDAQFNISNDLPVHYLRLLAPPLQLLSAAMWRVVQQGLVDHYGMLEEFVTMVTELVPELMSYSQRAQLTLGLRARLVLELCRGEQPADMQTMQPHLDRIKAPVSTAKDHHSTIDLVEESEVNFVELVHSLLEDPVERKYFFEEIFPVYFGPKYHAALEMLVWEFISRLEELLPVPDFTQLAALLGDAPSFLSDCLQSFFPPADMKALLEHHRNLGHFEEKDPRLLPMDDCILTSMSLPPGSKAVTDATSYLPAHRDPRPSEHHAGGPEAPAADASAPEAASRRLRESSREARKQNSCEETIDLTTSNDPEPEAPAASELSLSFRGGRALRKRRLSGGVETPAKQRMDASAFLESSMDDENSGESPLISIWGEYTDAAHEGPAASAASDAKLPWTEEETLHLLDIWGNDSVQRALKGCLKNRHIYVQIAHKMAERGFKRTVEQCQTRIKRLKKGFRQNKGTSRVEHTFYEHMKRVLGSPASAGAAAAPDSAYDVDEVIDDEESQDGDDDLQIVGQTSQEMGTRNVPWTEAETLALINTWGQEKTQQELRGANRTMHMFPIISTKMAAQGFSRTPEQCQTRLKRLKSSFRQCYENNMKGLEQVQCKFYHELARFLLKEHRSPPPPNEASADTDDNDSPSRSVPDVVSFVSLQDDRKKVPWADKETVILLELWGESQIQQNAKGFPPNVHLFGEISEKLSVHGFSRTAEQCHTRIKRLKTNYWQCRDGMSASGTDKVNFKFFDLMEQILDKRPSTSSAAVADPIEISEDSNGDSVTETAEGEAGLSVSSWPDDETSALIDIWGEEEVQRSLAGFVPNGHVYAEISRRLRDLGYAKTPEQCHDKVKTLKSNFLKCHEGKKCGRRVDDKFYHRMERAFGAEAAPPDECDEQDEAAPDQLNAPWGERETEALVEVWAADDVQHGLKTCVRNGHIFADIAERLAAAGYARSAEQCQARIKRLKKTYRRYCNSRRNGRSAAFRYFNLLAPVLGDNSLFNDADTSSSSASISLAPLDETYADIYEQPSTSHPLPDPSKKTPWSDRETHTLLEIWGEDNVQMTLRGCLKNRHVFEFISEKMGNRGYARTTEQCYTRIKRLKYGFLHEKQDFKFFREMEEIFSRDLKSSGSVVGIPAPDEPDNGTYEPIRDFVVSPGNQWLSDNSKHPWSDGETEVLLSMWGSEDVQENLKGCTKNKHIYMQISDALASQGYQRTPEQCQTRIKRLKYSFRQFLDGRRGDKQECKYFDQLVKIFGDKYLVIDPQPDDAADDIES
ncbi:uncharacterized protein LOC109520070 isoform X4 [Hippocampus comes]|uniref:uncharacterized protein LOC109520070 isoform X4 n=1 Tax=Hippocampus comes TaxID=109280 RepID=UPI00094F097A|nr:PREDICTED: uncharacterized protein LOC109520070 isoform X4 [Hippocampus comes]